ncbi:MAG: radical SAM protein [Candidatus Accumulibacter sp.]|uniref:Radical SAM protein n=1 Tax=Candidatus Accumulibacter proximus TaxID=2954385 RepID=A0A935UH03_9PROT|nr:radical SAM protein [Candidatus Accumulibacter proximus]
MIKELFSKYLYRTRGMGRTQEALAIILVPEPQVKRPTTKNRIEALVEQLNQAGIDDINAVTSDALFLDLEVPVGVRKIGFSSLMNACNTRTVVVIRSDQYHASHEWISGLVAAAREECASQVHENHASPLMGNLRLSCAFSVISSGDVSRVLKEWERVGYFSTLDLNPIFESLGISHTVHKLNGNNVVSFYRQATRMDLPISFVVETNSSCNYHCLMCPYHGGRQKDKPTFIKPGTAAEMPLQVFKRVIDEIAALDRRYEEDAPVTVSPYRRGEFLLYPYWKEALTHIKSKQGLRAFFSSNGSLWSDEDVRFVLDCGLDQLQISIEGHDLRSHRKIRLNNEFEQVVSTIRRIMHEKQIRAQSVPLLQLAHTVNERNFGEVDGYVNHWISKVDALFLGPENYADDITYNKRYKAEFSPVKPRPITDRPPCQMIKDCIWIDAEGTVILCIGAKQEIIGNVHEMSLLDILSSKQRVDILAEHAAGNYANDVCTNCEQWYSAYGETKETDEYSLFLSPDTQYYRSKSVVETEW